MTRRRGGALAIGRWDWLGVTVVKRVFRVSMGNVSSRPLLVSNNEGRIAMRTATIGLAAVIALSSSFAFAQTDKTPAPIRAASPTSVRPTPSVTTGLGGSPYSRKNDTNVYQDGQRLGPVPEPPNPHGG